MVQTGAGEIGLAAAHIVVISGMHLTRHAAQLAYATADQRTQQVGMGGVVAAGCLLVLCQLGPYPVELLLVDEGWDGGYGDPFRCWDRYMAFCTMTHRMRGGTPDTRGHRARAAGVDLSGIGRIGQDTPHRRCAPVCFAGRRGNTQRMQVLNQAIQGAAFLQIEGKHLTYDSALRFIYLNSCWITGPVGIDPVPVGGSSPGQQNTGAVASLATTAHPLRDQRTLIFGHCAANLQDQLLVGVTAQGPVQKRDLATMLLELLQQHHLVHIVTSQAVRIGDHDLLQFTGSHQVSQSIQAWAREGGSAVAIVAEDTLFWQCPALLLDIDGQAVQLLLNRLCLCLVLS